MEEITEKLDNITITEPLHTIKKVNKGTGAGGKNTNHLGKKFETFTLNENRLIENDFKVNTINKTKYGYYLSKKYDNEREEKEIIYVSQNGLKLYVKNMFNIDLFRCPDEAYIIRIKEKEIIEKADAKADAKTDVKADVKTDTKVEAKVKNENNKSIKKEKIIIKILEKKEQSVKGSVEIKLWSGPSLKREYELVFGEDYIIEYAFCLSEFLENKLKSSELKYQILNKIFTETNITLLYGDNTDYYTKLDEWIYH